MKQKIVLAVAAVCSIVAGVCAAEDLPVDIGARLELFTDKFLIDALDNAALRLHAPEPHETVLKFDKPWEGVHCGYVTVIKDGDLYRLYYRGLPKDKADGSDAETTCYAESSDSIHFTRPNLGIFEVAGTRDNNVILAGMAPLSHNFAPFLDTRPGVAPDQKYKALAGTSGSGLVGFVSADGIHWKKLREEPLITKGAFDSQNIGFWSDAEHCYVCYFRTFSDGFRTISRTTSPDFVTWVEPVEMSFGNTPREHLYTNQTRPYFRAPHIYIATAARFMQGRRIISAEEADAAGVTATYSGDCSDTVLLTTRGGSTYDRTFMEALVRPGIGAGNWTSRTNYPAHGVVPVSDTEMAMYVQRNYAQPTHHLQRLVFRTDGFASVNAPYTGGEMRTKPLKFSGNNLIINYATSAAGDIYVEILDEQGKPIPGFTKQDADPIIGDEIARTVSWKGNKDLSSLAGKTIRLRFIMKDADLYSICFR